MVAFKYISKTTFQEFLRCPKNIWLKLHKPELLGKFELSEFEKHLIEQGNEVESCARNLFHGGIEVKATGEEACRETTSLMASRTSTIFQATFIAGGFLVRNDMLSYNNETGCWDLYEVKGTNSLKEEGTERDHITDITFQVSVLKRSNIKIGKCFLVHLNKDYVRAGDLDYKSLFKVEEQTDKVNEKLSKVEEQMATAKEYLSRDTEPAGECECVYKTRKNHCTTFKYSNSRIPDYSVHDISRIGAKKLEFLIEHDLLDMNDVPDDFELSDIQKNQVIAHQTQRPMIEKVKIKEILDSLKFPLYFLDYEAYAPAIPMFSGYGPYKRVPFQFSLHILKSPDSEVEHVDFLHDEPTDPSEKIAKLLTDNILPGGSVIVWHKTYETGVNKEIGTRLPQYTKAFERINTEIYDLKEIFSDQLYVHSDFKGKSSIKKVLPVLRPDLRYDNLEIREGGQAVDAWLDMVSPGMKKEKKEKIYRDLKTYCGLDTYAMYAIWKYLYDMNR